MYFSSNIKLLRKRRKRTQEDVSSTLNLKRSTLSGYENNIAQPNIQILMAFSDYFDMSIDTLVKVNLSNIPEFELRQLERGYDTFLEGSKMRVLATTIDQDNEENIELVSEKAKAGYKSGFADPEYIRVLPTFRMPFLSKQKKYRTFQISGDSMLPIPDSAFVTGEFLQNWKEMKSHDAYIILTREDGVVFKVVENKIELENKLTLHSLNKNYEPFDLPAADIREVWKFINYISPEVPQPHTTESELIDTVRSLEKQVREIQMKLKL
ncbi:MAG: XRE family transcriptional regulator [Hyphomicrobiales bacterium]